MLAAKATLQKVRVHSPFRKPGERQAALVTRAVGGPERRTPLLGFFFFKTREAPPSPPPPPQRFIVKKLKYSKGKRTSEWTPIYSPPRFYYSSFPPAIILPPYLFDKFSCKSASGETVDGRATRGAGSFFMNLTALEGDKRPLGAGRDKVL